MMISFSSTSTALLVALATVLIGTFAIVGKVGAASPPVYAGIIKGVAVGGYDAVAYFTEGKPVPGNAGITLTHEGATWRFERRSRSGPRIIGIWQNSGSGQPNAS